LFGASCARFGVLCTVCAQGFAQGKPASPSVRRRACDALCTDREAPRVGLRVGADLDSDSEGRPWGRPSSLRQTARVCRVADVRAFRAPRRRSWRTHGMADGDRNAGLASANKSFADHRVIGAPTAWPGVNDPCDSLALGDVWQRDRTDAGTRLVCVGCRWGYEVVPAQPQQDVE
jgi:hypothetical protein